MNYIMIFKLIMAWYLFKYTKIYYYLILLVYKIAKKYTAINLIFLKNKKIKIYKFKFKMINKLANFILIKNLLIKSSTFLYQVIHLFRKTFIFKISNTMKSRLIKLIKK